MIYYKVEAIEIGIDEKYNLQRETLGLRTFDSKARVAEFLDEVDKFSDSYGFPIPIFILFSANSDAETVKRFVLTREKINEIDLGYSEIHIESFNKIGNKKLEHDIEEPLDLSDTSGTRYFSKFSNVNNDRSTAVRIVFTENDVTFDIVNIARDGSATVDNDFNIFKVYAKKLRKIEG